jgi:hypothetical protein
MIKYLLEGIAVFLIVGIIGLYWLARIALPIIIILVFLKYLGAM